MSVTLVVVPAALGSQVVLGLITSLIASATVSGAIASTANNTNTEEKYITSFSYDNLVAGAMNKDYNKQGQTICSQYKTAFKDESLLIKTLNEHGVENITTANNKIYCNLESLNFEFEKDSEGVYIMDITHKENDNMDVVNELGEEYQLNAQEKSYIDLKNKLEKQNLEIDSEEVLEDNSIMITVNLD